MRVLTLEQTYKVSVERNLEYFNIAPTPHNEDCVPAGRDAKDGILECTALAQQLQRKYGNPPEGAEFFIQKNYHEEAGTYYELCLFYIPTQEREWDEDKQAYTGDEEESEGSAYAYKCEDIPDFWDEEAVNFLHQSGYSLYSTPVVQMNLKTA